MSIYSAYAGLNQVLTDAGFIVNYDCENIENAGHPELVYTDNLEIRDVSTDSVRYLDYNLLYTLNMFSVRQNVGITQQERIGNMITNATIALYNNGRSVDGIIRCVISDNNANTIAFETDHDNISGAVLKFEVLYRINLQA